MPGLITATEFVEEALDDYHSPTTSTFVEKMTNCRQTVSYLEQSLDYDREGLIKMKKAVKSIYTNGLDIVESEQSLSKNLSRLGDNAMSKDFEPEIGAAFIKFSIVTKELSSLMKGLMQNLNNTVMYPLDNILKGELKGVKGDLKKPFEKAWKDYETKILKIEKEKKQQAKEAGLIRTEISSAEVAEEMDKERKAFQLQMCEYLLKVNDIKTKKGVELLQHLVDYYHAQIRYYQDGLDHLKHFNTYISELSNKLETIKSSQDEERKQLYEIKNLLNNGENGINVNTSSNSNSSSSNTNNLESNKRDKSIYNLHQLKGNKHYGFCKSGYLLKKSEGKMKMKVWQKRKCEINGFNSENSSSFLNIYHSDESKTPTKVNLLTCQVKTIPDDKCSFDLMSFSRTYHFQAEDELDADAWISVILNCKESVLKKEFDNNNKSIKNQMISTEDYVLNETVNELRKNIISNIIKLPGNHCCVDCNSTNDANWISTNFGILVCIECSGIHRELGVQVSRIQSLTLDNIGISLLLLAKNMSNNAFNSVYESNLENYDEKINSQSSMDQRSQFIRSKYLKRKFIKNKSGGDNEILKQNLEQAINSKNIYQILQCYAENNQCINWVLPSLQKTKDTSLYLAISQEDNNSLHIVDFLIQNSANINYQNLDGNTALHHCIIKNKSEILKLLLRSCANINIVNKDEKDCLTLAKELKREYLVQLIEQSIKNKKSLIFENLNIDWDLKIEYEQQSTDFSDEDLNEDKLNAKEYFDWILNSRTNSVPPIQSNEHQKLNQRIKKMTSNNDNIIVDNNLNKNYQTDQSRSSSVIEKEFNNNNSISKLRVPPLPQKNIKLQQPVIATKPLTLSNSNNNNELSKKEQFLKNKTMMHSRTISDLGLKLPGNHRKNASIDLSTNTSSSFNNHQTNTYLNDKNSKRRTFIDTSCSQLNNLDNLINLQRQNSIPPNLHNSQTNLIQSNQFLNNNNNNNNMNNKNCKIENNKLARRKQPVFIDNNRHLSNGQSFESLPSSDDLNHSNNSGSNHNNLINNICSNQSLITNTYSPVPVPPPRRRDNQSNTTTTKLKTAIALFDCSKDQDDELEFFKDDIIIITKEETNDQNWVWGKIDNREGLLPISFVRILN